MAKVFSNGNLRSADRNQDAVRGDMKSGVLFPVGWFPRLVREAILNEFEGRCPTAQEVLSLSDGYWLSVPHIGSQTLNRMRSAAYSVMEAAYQRPLAGKTEAELHSSYQRLVEQMRKL